MIEEKYNIEEKYQVKITIDDSRAGYFKWDAKIMLLTGRKMFSKDFHSEQEFTSSEECLSMAKYVVKNLIQRNP